MAREWNEGGGVLRPDVKEDFGPEDAVDAGGDLVGGRGHDDEPGEVVFDESAHGEVCGYIMKIENKGIVGLSKYRGLMTSNISFVDNRIQEDDDEFE